MSAFSAVARDFFTSPASPSTSAALAPLTPDELLRVVAHLVEDEALLHLEAFADCDALPKALRKAARFSLYQLRSKGVAAPVQSRVVSFAAPVAVDLAQAAIVYLPGLYGRFWLFLGPLPGVSAIEVRGEAHGTLDKIEPMPGVAPGRLKKLLSRFAEVGSGQAVRARPFICSADLALRLLDHLEALIRLPGHPDESGLPTSWANVLLWRERAIALGADPMRARARGQVALPSLDDALTSSCVSAPRRDETHEDVTGSLGQAFPPLTAGAGRLPEQTSHLTLARESGSLVRFADSGPHAPPPWIVQAVLADVMEQAEAATSTGVAPSDHAGLMREIALAHCDAFLGDPVHARRAALSLEASADGLFALGLAAQSTTLLAVADVLVARSLPPREVGLFAAAFEQLVDPDLLSRARSVTP